MYTVARYTALYVTTYAYVLHMQFVHNCDLPSVGTKRLMVFFSLISISSSLYPSFSMMSPLSSSQVLKFDKSNPSYILIITL